MGKGNFVEIMFQKYKFNHANKMFIGTLSDAQEAQLIVDSFINHYRDLYNSDMRKGVPRKLSWRSSAQTYLSKFRRKVKENGAHEEFLSLLHLPSPQSIELMKEKQENVRKSAIDLPLIQGDAWITDCRSYLEHPDWYLRVIAVAALTGRRESEIILTCEFEKPREKHYTDSKYWSNVTGILKQRPGDPDAVREREIPLLAERTRIRACVASIRKQSRAITESDVNRVYASGIARRMHRHCPEMRTLHEFRKFYAASCFWYFNERNCSLPRAASDYLGHKKMAEAVLTYLSIRVEGLGSLNFGIGQLRHDANPHSPDPLRNSDPALRQDSFSNTTSIPHPGHLSKPFRSHDPMNSGSSTFNDQAISEIHKGSTLKQKVPVHSEPYDEDSRTEQVIAGLSNMTLHRAGNYSLQVEEPPYGPQQHRAIDNTTVRYAPLQNSSRSVH